MSATDMKTMDTNGDGVISKSERKAYQRMHKNKKGNSKMKDGSMMQDGSMNDGSMANVCCFLQQNGSARKHVKGAIFLNIATILNYNLSPIATNGSTRTDVHIFTD